MGANRTATRYSLPLFREGTSSEEDHNIIIPHDLIGRLGIWDTNCRIRFVGRQQNIDVSS